MGRKKTFFRYLFSYIVVLIIPIISISYFIYYRFMDEFEAEIMTSSVKVLEQARDMADNYFEGFKYLTYNLSSNPYISLLLSQDNAKALDNYPYIFNAIRELNKYKNANPTIQDIFIIFKGQDLVISNSSKYDLNGFSQYLFKLDNASNQIFGEVLREIKGEIVLPFNDVRYNDRKAHVICYFHDLPMNNIFSKAVLVITIDQDVLKRSMENFLGKYKGYIYVLNDNDIIMHSQFNDSQLLFEQREMLLSEIKNHYDSSYSVTKNGYVISVAQSKRNGWKYVSIIPSSNILSKTKYIYQKMTIIIISTLSIGILIILYFSAKDYNKINKIIDLIENYDTGFFKSSKYTNEWELIRKAIINYVFRNQELYKKLQQQMPIMKNSFFSKLINGDIDSQNAIEGMMEFLGLDFKKQHYGVLVIEINAVNDKNNVMVDNSKDFRNSRPIKEVIYAILTNIIEKVVDKNVFIYTLENQNSGALNVIIGIDDRQLLCKETYLKEIGCLVKDIIKESLGVTVTIGVGNLYDDLLNLKDSYREACEALQYKMLVGYDNVISYREISARNDKGIYYSFKQEKELINYIRMGAYEDVQRIIEQIVNSLKSQPISLNSVKYICVELINTAIKVAAEIGIHNSEVDTLMEKMVYMETLDEVYTTVLDFYSRLCATIKEAKMSKSTELRDKVMQYIKENYMDSMLSVASIADHFSVSPSYLSRYMKDYMGRSLTDCIHEVRLEHAKLLLEKTDKPVAQIAEEVGYNSLHNFSRVFKRYEGITPTDYRLIKMNTT